MSVIQIDGNEVWGASSRLIYDILEYSIRINGNREFLLDFKKQYDFGYNSISLEDIGVGEIELFRDLIRSYIDERQFCRFGEAVEDREELESVLEDLVSAIDNLLHRRFRIPH